MILTIIIDLDNMRVAQSCQQARLLMKACHNVRLMRDTGEVGVIETEIRQGARVAPQARIYLDCLAERRGEDIAEQFRDAVLGY